MTFRVHQVKVHRDFRVEVAPALYLVSERLIVRHWPGPPSFG